MNDGATHLNKLETYEQLAQRASRIGYKIESIIYNGYVSSDALQQIQDNAINARTQLRMDAEIDEQKNNLINLRLKSQNDCLSLEAELNKLKIEFEQKMLDLNTEFKLSIQEKKHLNLLKQKEIDQKKLFEFNSKIKEINEAHLVNLNDLGVDVNKYQIESNKSKNKLDKIYELIN